MKKGQPQNAMGSKQKTSDENEAIPNVQGNQKLGTVSSPKLASLN
jgi:hypothetical protein